MSKEMIISVNGREKKIAILDNGRVTEFYIERGEENSGVVGNIYKGRVQRVLPGMQSAFVEIGLERDAFLYVSDFFDEEEEIERIVMEKSKKGSPEEARREADDRIERARLEREKQMESVQEIAEPLRETAAPVGETNETELTVVEDSPDEEEFQPQSRRGREKRRGKKERAAQVETRSPEMQTVSSNERISDDADDSENNDENNDSEESNQTQVFAEAAREDFAPIFDEEDSNFERVVDADDEETTGDMFKDAYVQEAIVDKVRAVEFDMESTAEAEVGSLLASVSDAPNGFERIADEDEESAQQAPTGKNKNRSRGGKGRKKNTGTVAPVDADENSEATNVITSDVSDAAETTPKSKGRGKSSRKAAKSGDSVSETTATESVEANQTENRSEDQKKTGRGRKSNRKSKKTTDTDALEEAEASVRETGDIADMAVRRGGRGGRNRRAGRGGRTENEDQTIIADDGEIEIDESEAIESTPVEKAETRPERPVERPAQNRSEGREFTDNRGGRKEFQGGNGGGQRRDSRDNRDNRDNRSERGERRPQPPTITDLLREGQEILVQIAKEPIARKGARITSHIALPGRFLVYMPTIEHLGVSRKIESASERSRLRALIQNIKRDEDVPTGGFIVRTAGVGISDEDLRQDARYLVRTWQDIKKSSEKKKSPALVHQDLDIIQRLLRDQLSDDFTAIRVDSEEE
ncbi:MAG TPA: ribonuclease E/G, partial [Pyrinomonadaceae bacterium]